jgi:FkbM family methyltransferase
MITLLVTKIKRFAKKLIKNATKPFSFNLPVKVGNRHFMIPIFNGRGWSNLLAHEPWMLKLMTHILNFRHGAFIDVGANTGQTLLALRSLSPNIPYIGFEINSNSYQILKSVVDSNKLDKCTLIPMGLSNLFDVVSVWSVQEDGSFATIENALVSDNMKLQSFGVVTKLDDLMNKDFFVPAIKDGIACIKIDVEGHELEVLQGAVTSISKYRPFIIIEVLNHVLQHKKKSLLEWCKANNYNIQIPDFSSSVHFIPCVNVDNFQSRESYKPEESNYLLVPVEYG